MHNYLMWFNYNRSNTYRIHAFDKSNMSTIIETIGDKLFVLGFQMKINNNKNFVYFIVGIVLCESLSR